MVGKCVQACCCPKKALKHELKLGKTCVVAAGVYRNVDVEINEHCQVVRLTLSDKTVVNLCDPCANVGRAAVIAPVAATMRLRDDALSVEQGRLSTTSIFANDDLPAMYHFHHGAVPSGVSIDGGGFVHVGSQTPAGVYAIPYTISDSMSSDRATATLTLTVTNKPRRPLQLNDDHFSVVAGAISDSVMLNDSLSDGTTPNAQTASVTALNAPNGISLDADGRVKVASHVAAGTYQFDYRLCDSENVCANARVVLTVRKRPPSAIASDKQYTLYPGQTSPMITEGDTLADGSTPTADNAFVTVDNLPPALRYDASSRTVSVAHGTAAGTYRFEYEVCPLADGDCATANVVVIVRQGGGG